MGRWLTCLCCNRSVSVERMVGGGRRSTPFGANPSQTITSALFDYCLADFWARFRKGEETLTFREVTLAACSPGQVFKLPEDDIDPVWKRTPHQTQEGRICTNLPPFRAWYPAERARRQSLSRMYTRRSRSMRKSSPAIADFFRVPTRFLRSVQLERDFHDVAALEQYVVTPYMAEAFRRIAAGLRANSGSRAWRITGDYGVGNTNGPQD